MLDTEFGLETFVVDNLVFEYVVANYKDVGLVVANYVEIVPLEFDWE